MKDYNQKVVGKQIQKYRAIKGLNQTEFAKVVGISSSYLGDIEHGGRSKNSSLSMKNIDKIAGILGISLDDLADTNIEYPKSNTKGVAADIEKELYSMSVSELVLFDKIADILVNKNENKTIKNKNLNKD